MIKKFASLTTFVIVSLVMGACVQQPHSQSHQQPHQQSQQQAHQQSQQKTAKKPKLVRNLNYIGPKSKTPPVVATTLVEDSAAVIASSNQLGFDLFKAQNETSENLFYSPYAVSKALSMILLGSKGQSATQLKRNLNLSIPPARIAEAYHMINLQVAAIYKPGQTRNTTTLNIGTALWGPSGTNFDRVYQNNVAKNLGANVFIKDFKNNSQSAYSSINSWVSTTTHDKLPQLNVQTDKLKIEGLMMTSVLSFKDNWNVSFDPSLTKNKNFASLKHTRSLPMMEVSDEFNYASGKTWRAIDIAYGDGLIFTAILPNNLKTFESTFTSDEYKSIQSSMNRTPVHLSMPKFSISPSAKDLIAVFEKMGIRALFDPVEADLSGMAVSYKGPLYISHFLHQSSIEVDEQGNQSHSVNPLSPSSMYSPTSGAHPVQLMLNKPFVFIIHDEQTGLILFMGHFIP